MQFKKLTIVNIGAIANEVIVIDKPLLLFYGEILQGKSTILNCVRWVCGGSFPSDIIRRGEKEASIALEFDGGMIARSWYVNKENVTTARAVQFIRNGKPVPSPVNEIRRLLNPFMLDQDHLIKMSELDRKRFFADLFAVDTTEIDKAIWNAANEASSLRSHLSGYGDIDVTVVESVDVKQLEDQLSFERDGNQKAEKKYNEQKQSAEKHNANIQVVVDSNDGLEKQIVELQERLKKSRAWLKENSPLPMPSSPALVDTTILETKLREAGAQNVRHENYKANVERNNQKLANEKKLSELEAAGRKLKAEKVAKLKGINETCKIAGLKFDDDGNFTYHGNHAGMLSTSQLMTLSSELSSLYPENLGIELIDKAESLGKSIFTFVKRAQDEKKTILATIVGEKPANVPENIGVFVVEQGKIKP